jgi:hypothetical protein
MQRINVCYWSNSGHYPEVFWVGVKFNNLLARRDLDELRELFPSERLFQKFSGDRVLHH